MEKKKPSYIYIIVLSLALLLAAPPAWSQVQGVSRLVAQGDSLRVLYDFAESSNCYKEALDSLQGDGVSGDDSLLMVAIGDKLLLSENGKNMASYVYWPNVIARHQFSLHDFFLYYPLADKSWRPAPNHLDPKSGPFAKAVYAPEGTEVIYYSAADQEGIRNIYRTQKKGSAWTLPSLLNEKMISDSDEIYPVISHDGKYMYFASEGLYGVGGFDLYVSEWDEAAEDWSVPANMGFPYSSPANDFLLVNSEDGKYTLFASDRGCPKDSVWVYVLEHDSMPVRTAVDDPEELLRLSHMELKKEQKNDSHWEVKTQIPENVDTRRYMDKMAQVRALKDSMMLCERRLADFRERYSMVDDGPEKNRLEEAILKNESLVPLFQAEHDEAVRQLQAVEMDFLFSGVVIDPDRLLAEAEREIVSESPDYVFSKMNMGAPLALEMEKPVSKFDYSFKILKKGQFAEDNTIPGGIVYQIQIFSLSQPATVSNLKGLSPVFVSRSSTGRYIYRVGLFRTYSDVLSCLNRVKRQGFKSAYVVGYIDGKEVSVKKARDAEAVRKNAAPEDVYYNVIINPAGGELDSVAMGGIRQQSAGKDIARVEEGLLVGPFENKSEAETLIEFVQVMGYGQAKLEIKKL